jgi:hypothetical protein
LDKFLLRPLGYTKRTDMYGMGVSYSCEDMEEVNSVHLVNGRVIHRMNLLYGISALQFFSLINKYRFMIMVKKKVKKRKLIGVLHREVVVRV